MALTKVTYSMIDQNVINVMDFGAVGDGVTNDTAAVQAAIDTGKDVYIPEGMIFAVTGNVTNFANNQHIFGGGTLKKLGSTLTPIVLLPDMSDGVWFENIRFDGTIANFAPGNPVPAILGYITYSLKVTECYFFDVVDVGIKLRDGAGLYAAGNTFYRTQENGIECHNYAYDVRTGGPYTNPRPPIEGNHQIIGNRFEYITREEIPGGLLVDACGFAFQGVTNYPCKNIVVNGNVFVDCHRCVWTENNTTGSEAVNVSIVGNTFMSNVRGNYTTGYYAKNAVGLIGVVNGAVIGNTFTNIATYNPTSTETACISISGLTATSTQQLEISGNTFNETRTTWPRTQFGIYANSGTNVSIHDNMFYGFGGSPHPDPAILPPQPILILGSQIGKYAIFANGGATEDQAWKQPFPVPFMYANFLAGAATELYVNNFNSDTEYVIPCGCVLVGASVKLSASLPVGETISVTFSATDGVTPLSLTEMTITQADFPGGGAAAHKLISPLSAQQLYFGQRFKTTVTTSAGFGSTNDILVTAIFDMAYKRAQYI